MTNTAKQQIIFFVGPDKTGKTNIAKAVSASSGVPYFKASSEHASFMNKRDLFINQLRYADMRVFDLIKQTGLSVIFDRGYPCEYVYAAVTGRQTDLEMLRLEDDSYASIDAKIVFCYRSSYDNLCDDIDPTIDSKKLQELSDRYCEFIDKFTHCKVMKLCVDDENLSEQSDRVLAFMSLTTENHDNSLVPKRKLVNIIEDGSATTFIYKNFELQSCDIIS